MRRHFGIALPVEVRYDEFTDDILANRLVKAAVSQLSGMRLRSLKARRGLSWVAAMLDQVSPVEFLPNEVPGIRFDRLNEHYRGVVGLARLVLRHSAFESGRGYVRASGFLMNMNDLFQEFVTVALREALGVSEKTLRSDKGIRGVTLDEDDAVGLEPDLSWWDGALCTFVGDAKYKNLTNRSVPTTDLYQLLAYGYRAQSPGRAPRLRAGRGGRRVVPGSALGQAPRCDRGRLVRDARRGARASRPHRREGARPARRSTAGPAGSVVRWASNRAAGGRSGQRRQNAAGPASGSGVIQPAGPGPRSQQTRTSSRAWGWRRRTRRAT